MNNKELPLALQMADEALRHNRWAKLHVDKKIVILEVGPVNADGSRQTKTATYRFYTDALGAVHYVVNAHP